MKKLSKWIIGGIVLVAIFFLASEGLNYYLKGPKMQINAILVSGKSEDINEAKEVYKDNTKYTKEYKYKMVVKEETNIADNGEEVTITNKQMLITKNTVKEMIKDQIFREKTSENGDIKTELLTEMPNIDSDKNIILGSDYENTVSEVNINGLNIPVVYGCYSWIGYVPSDSCKIIVDDSTYESIDGEELEMSLIRLKKSKLDLRNVKDQMAVKSEISDVSEEIDVNFAIIKD